MNSGALSCDCYTFSIFNLFWYTPLTMVYQVQMRFFYCGMWSNNPMLVLRWLRCRRDGIAWRCVTAEWHRNVGVCIGICWQLTSFARIVDIFIPLPRSILFKLMDCCQLFCFKSIVGGPVERFLLQIWLCLTQGQSKFSALFLCEIQLSFVIDWCAECRAEWHLG